MRVVIFVALAGCSDSPTRDCELTCVQAEPRCPSGMSCDSQNFCREPGATESCMPNGCWPLAPSTIDPCAMDFPPSMGSLSFTQNQVLDTTMPLIGQLYDGGRLVVIHVDQFSVANMVTVTVEGTRPLVIVSDGDVAISGILRVNPTSSVDPVCTINNGSDANLVNWSTGGGGGGFATAGGAGGIVDDPDAARAPGGSANDDPALLRFGCPGGAGGGNLGGLGGRAGGALQIAAKTRVDVTGWITANGGGGAGGWSSADCTGDPCSTGGGGGGTGGVILIESPIIDVDPDGLICAVGGAGGSGGLGTNTSPAPPGGTSITCTGGAPGELMAPGGKGGDLVPPGIGFDSTQLGKSAGGGGGSVGRIRINATEPTLGGMIVPPP